MASLEQSNWIKTPTKKHLIIITVVWFIAVITIVLGRTNMFSKTFLDIKYLITYYVLLYSAFIVLKAYRNYFKNNRSDSVS